MLEKLCSVLIEQSSKEIACNRYKKRVDLKNGGILSRLHVVANPIKLGHEDDFGHKVIIRDVSLSGLGLLSNDFIVLNVSCVLHIGNFPAFKGILIYLADDENGQYRYGFSLDEWLTVDEHKRISV